MEYFRTCKVCHGQVQHKSAFGLKIALDRNLPCNKCKGYTRGLEQWSRPCPRCSKKIKYSSEDNLQAAISRKSICKSCAVKDQYEVDPAKNKGCANGRYGVSLFELWNRTNPLEAEQLKASWRLKQHDRMMGDKNPSFGKSPTIQSGMSYKGKYKGMFFRSSFELAFIMQYEVKHKQLPISAELKEFRIKLPNGRTYVPDFYCPIDKLLIEVKSKNFRGTALNLMKAEAAAKQCVNWNLTYQIIDQDELDLPGDIGEWLYDLHQLQIIQLIPISLQKLTKRLSSASSTSSAASS